MTLLPKKEIRVPVLICDNEGRILISFVDKLKDCYVGIGLIHLN